MDSRVQDATPVELPAPELKNLNDIFEMVNTTALRDRDGLVAGLLKDVCIIVRKYQFDHNHRITSPNFYNVF